MNKLVSKQKLFVSALALLLAALLLSTCSAPKEQAIPGPSTSQTGGSTPAMPELKGKITVSGAFALYPMMVKWAEEFQKIHPGVRIDVSAGGAGKGAADALAGLVDIGMVSRGVFPVEVERGAFYVSSVIDAVVPVASAANPVKEELLARGIKRQGLVDIWISGKMTDWKNLFPGANAFGKTGLHVYTRSDAAGAPETWALYLGQKQEDLLGTGVYGDPGLAETVRRDPLGIGFNNIGYVYDAKSRKQVEGLLIIPIDLNENGRIDPEENLYSTLDEVTRAIAAGVYPSPPARELNLVTLREFKGVTREFAKWILTEGQRYAAEAGFVPLSKEKLQTELGKLG